MNREPYTDRETAEQKAWLQLVYTRGIGPRTAWKIYYQVHDSGMGLGEALTRMERGEENSTTPQLSGINRRLTSLNLEAAQKRLEVLQGDSIHLYHPDSLEFKVPEIEGLPPTLAMWGDVALLNSQDFCILLTSRDTHESFLKEFLHKLAQGEIEGQVWCFCPFSKRDWELTESLMKLDCGVVLGLISGITRRALMLARENTTGRVLLMAPEPPPRSRSALFNSIEAFYHLLFKIIGQVYLLHARERGRTAKRLQWARKAGCRITRFIPSVSRQDTGAGGLVPAPADNRINDDTAKPVSDDDDRFISCL